MNTDLDFYRHIVPCGAPDKGVTSMKKLLGESIELDTVAYTLQYHFGRLMGFRMTEEDSSLTGLMGAFEPSSR